MYNYDAIIIGTGQAGPQLARRLAGARWRVAIIERGRFGGTCVNTGCTPTKAMVASAYAAHTVGRASEFGLVLEGTVSVDWRRIKTRKDAISEVSRRAIERSLCATDGAQLSVRDRITAYALYTNPPLGRAGLTLAQAQAAGHRTLVGTIPMEDVSRAYEKSETSGFMKIVVDADNGTILGASFLGTGCDEVIHCVLDVMYAKAPYHILERAMHNHPTLAEFIATLVADLRPT